MTLFQRFFVFDLCLRFKELSWRTTDVERLVDRVIRVKTK